MANIYSPSVVAPLDGQSDRVDLGGGQPLALLDSAHFRRADAAIPALSAVAVNLSLLRSPSVSGRLEASIAGDPGAASLQQAITLQPSENRRENSRNFFIPSQLFRASQGHATASPPLQPSPAAESHRFDPSGGSLERMKEPDEAEVQTELFSQDNALREATVVSGSDQTSSVALMDLVWTFQLHSSPTSSKVIYLDFNGHTTTGTSWNNATMGASFYSPAFDLDGNPSLFNSEELSRIQQVWQRVAADYAPFDVDVTTQEPPTDWLIKSSGTDANYGMRAVITSYGPSSSIAGGIASVNSFNASKDMPCFVYNKSLTAVAEAISHEVGHTLGLSHDGTSSSAYDYGHGSGETSWAPIMGVGYNKNVTQWDNGTYYGTNNGSATANYGHGPNDMAVITSFNGFGYQLDQVGNTISTATPLTISGGVVGQFGRIETALDSDFYSFQLQSSGNLNLKFDPYCYRAFVDLDGLWGGGNLAYTAPVSDGNSSTPYPDSGTDLDLSVDLYASSGSLLGSFNGAGLATSLAWSNLAAGTYFLKLDGVGTGNPTSSTPSGYNDYGSVGNYLISGTITHALDSATLSATTTPLAPRDATLSSTHGSSPSARIISPAATLGASAFAPTDPLTGIAAGAVSSLEPPFDSLLAPQRTTAAPGSPSMASGAAKAGGFQDGASQAAAAVTLLGALSDPCRSASSGDPAATLGALSFGSQGATTQQPAWALA